MSERVPNFRDLGGLPVAGGRVAPGRLWRSALPLAGDRPPATPWPPATVVDLRSVMEIEPEHPLAADGVTVHNFPLLSALKPGVAPPESLAELYQLMLRTTARTLIDVVSTIAAAEGPTLVHCAAGKDRTGVTIAMVLALLGADRDVILSDYLLTAENFDEIEARFRRLYGPRPLGLPTHYLATPREAMVGVLDTWDAYPGGPLGWFRRWGGTDATVEQLRSTLVE